MRTLYCGELRTGHIGQIVELCGWVHRRRDHGGVIFLDLRDREGIAQVVFDPDAADDFQLANKVRNEFVLHVRGFVHARPAGSENPDMPTGEVEVFGSSLEILNSSRTPPFQLDDYSDAGEEVRLRHRYLDLRRPEMLSHLQMRAKITSTIRQLMEAQGFLDVETPVLGRSTPEGARDYLIPSRVHAGRFYALPQSPQLFKQLLMASGVDRYYQIAKCFRDEDLRADRQPEFTQLDVEASFVSQEDIMQVTETMLKDLFREVLAVEVTSFKRLTWREAMQSYGTDKPDLRNPLQLVDIADQVKDIEFKVFREPATQSDGRVVALRVPGAGSLSRKELDDYAVFVGKYGAAGLAYIKVNNSGAGMAGLQSPILKFIDEPAVKSILQLTEAGDGDAVFFGAGKTSIVNDSMSAFRDQIARDMNLVEEGFAFCWITQFPMFEEVASGKWTPLHHPFTQPDCTPEALRENPGAALSLAYDVVLNGYELGGGSLRIHQVDMQKAVFEVLAIGEQAEHDFAPLLEALQYGCPPHGGIAFGLDRIVMLMAGAPAIREVIAFPKTQAASDLLMAAPDQVSAEQLRELHLRLDKAAE